MYHVSPEIAPPKALCPATLDVAAAPVMFTASDGDAEDGEKEDSDGDPVSAVNDELLSRREGQPDGAVGDGHGERGLQEEGQEGVEAEDEAVTGLADATGDFEAARKRHATCQQGGTRHMPSTVILYTV